MNTDYSLIDANLVRAKEGLRVLDEIARFVVRDETLFVAFKQLRHSLVSIEEKIGEAHLLASRRGGDVGNSAAGKECAPAHSVWQVVEANANRITEALRVLEEVCKVYAPESVEMLMSIRYKVYELQVRLARRTPHFWLHYYFEQGIIYPLSESVLELQYLIEHGARVVQLRDKNSSTSDFLNSARQLVLFIKDFEVKHREKILLLINDNLSVAERLPVAGIHIGQGDSAVAQARQRIGMNKIIGRSNGSVTQMQESVKLGADYVSLGPVFPTPIKSERIPVGLLEVAKAAQTITVPWVVIGGIDQATIGQVRQAGAKNSAVIRSARQFFV